MFVIHFFFILTVLPASLLSKALCLHCQQHRFRIPTPADPQSMLLMAIPLTVLYFGGVLLCQLMPRHRSPYDDEPEDQPPED